MDFVGNSLDLQDSTDAQKSRPVLRNMVKKQPLPESQCPHLSKVLAPLWSKLSILEQEQLTLWTTCYAYEPNEMVYSHSDKLEFVYILAEGQVKLVLERDHPQITSIVKPSEFFGYSNFFAESPASIRAIAITKSIVYHFPIHGLETIIQSNPAVAMYFIRDLSSLLLKSFDQTICLTQKHIRGRLADTVIKLGRKFGTPDESGKYVEMSFSRADLSDLSCMNQSNVTRTLKTFEVEGLLRLDGKKIMITDPEGLDEVCRMG